MKIFRPLLTAVAAVLAGVGAGFWHWSAKALVNVGDCLPLAGCPPGTYRLARPPLGVDDVPVGLVAAIVAAVIAQILLRLLDRRTHHAAPAPS